MKKGGKVYKKKESIKSNKHMNKSYNKRRDNIMSITIQNGKEDILKINQIMKNSYLYNIMFDNDGNYIVAGYTELKDQNINNGLIIKLDSNLNVLAVKIYNEDDYGSFYDIAVDDDGNYVVVGFTHLKNENKDNALIVKLDSNLNILATKIYNKADYDYFYNIKIDDDGNYIVVGRSDSNLNSNLNILTAETYDKDDYDYPYDLAVDDDGNYIAIKRSDSDLEDQENSNGLIVKFDKNLNIINSKIYRINDDSSFSSMAIDKDGNYIAVGYIELKNKRCDDALIVKFDKNFNILAAETYGGNKNNYFRDIVINDNNDYIVIGYTHLKNQDYHSALIAKFDSNLNILNNKVYAKAYYDDFSSIAIDNDGNYIVAGYTELEDRNKCNILIIKFDRNLNKLATKIYNEDNYSYPYDLAVDDNGNCIIIKYISIEDKDHDNNLIVKFEKIQI